MNNTNNIIDFATRKPITSNEASPNQDLVALTYANVDEAFEVFLHYMAEELEYDTVMEGNEDLEIIMGYILTFLRGAFVKALDMEDCMTDFISDVVRVVKEERDGIS